MGLAWEHEGLMIYHDTSLIRLKLVEDFVLSSLTLGGMVR